MVLRRHRPQEVPVRVQQRRCHRHQLAWLMTGLITTASQMATDMLAKNVANMSYQHDDDFDKSWDACTYMTDLLGLADEPK